MKKVIRLTESELIKVIKSVIKEQAPQPAQQPTQNVQRPNIGNTNAQAQKAWGLISKAIEGAGTNLDLLKQGVTMINSKLVYDQILGYAKSKNMKFKTVMDYILTDFMTPMVDQPMRTSRQYNVNQSQWDKEGWSRDKDTQTALYCAKILQKYNPEEYNSLVRGSHEDKPV